MSVFRKNTLVVDFSVLPKRPDAGKVQQFLEKKVKLQLADTKTIQLHNLRNCVYIETIDLETALRYEKANNYQHTIVYNKKEFKIPVYVESEAVTVRVHDLPSHTEHLTVINFMKQYGVVLSISRERWKHRFPGQYNGVRVLRMTLSRPIPSCVTIDGETTLVTYRNQPKTFHHCGKAAHPKQKCIHTAPIGSSGEQLNGDEFPLLTQPSEDEEANHVQDSTVTKTNEEIEMQQNENNTTSNNGDDNDYDDDDDNDDDDDGNGSSDTNDFIEPTRKQKRRTSKNVKNQRANEKKKVCIIQGRQNSNENHNRFQALIEQEINEYSNGVKDKNRKGNTSTVKRGYFDNGGYFDSAEKL